MEKEVRMKLPTHVWLSKKTAMKVNGQKLYSGVNHHTRNALGDDIKNLILEGIPADFNLKDMMPLRIWLEWHVVPNYETVKRKRGSTKENFILSGGKVEEGQKFEPAFDADNQWIWIKWFLDTIKGRYIPEDTVKYVPDVGRVKFVPVDHIDDMKLVFKMKKIEGEYLQLLEKYFEYE